MQGTLMSSDFVGPAKGMSVMDFYNKCASSTLDVPGPHVAWSWHHSGY